MDLLTLVVVVGILFVLLVLYGRWKQRYWARQGVPQLNPNLIFGDLQPLMAGGVSIQDYFLELYKIAQTNNSKHLGLYNLWMAEYMPVDLEIIKNIMTKDFIHFDSHGVYRHKKDLLSENLFTLDGEAWKKRRTKMTPTFTSGKMKMMFETLLEKTVVLKKVLNQAAEVGKGVVLKELTARFATDIIASIAFGLDTNTLEEPDHKFREIGKKALAPKGFKFALESIVNSDVLAHLGYRTNPKDVRDYFQKLVKETIKYRDTGNVQRNDFMQLLLQLRDKNTHVRDDGLMTEGKFSERDVINEAFVFYLGGFETSSSVMSFAFLELAQRDDMQEKLRQEILETLDKYDGKLTYDGLMEMNYMDKIVKETLRKYPALADLPRGCTKTYKIPNTNVTIKKGTMVHIPVIGIHRDPQYYPNPDEFNPENFSPENKAKRPDFTFMPFGEGPRMCIGLRFGQMQAKVGIATVIKNYRLTLDERTKLPIEMEPGSIIFATKEDILIKVSKI